MLRTNKQIVTAFRRFNRPTRGEISDKIMKALAVSESMVTKRFDKASFTLEERKKVEKK